MTYIVAVANQKGGVAKTTTVVSVGGALIELGMKVLLVDLDSQGDLTLALGYNPKKVGNSIADILLDSGNILNSTVPTSIRQLDLIPSNSEMDMAERFLPIRQNYERILRSALRNHTVQSDYDFILLDCPPLLGAVTINALNAADMLVIPTQPEYFSAHALRNMMGAIKRVRNMDNPNLIYRILITMQDRRNRIHRNLSEQIQATFGDGLMRTVIETDTKLRESSIAGIPINYYKANTRSTLQYQALAQELTQYVERTNTQTA